MRPANPDNPHYKSIDSLDIMLDSATEYIPRHFKRTRPGNLTWVGAFLWAISEGYTAREACERAGVGYSSIFAERERNPDFAAAWEEALRCGNDALADVAVSRAKEKSDLLLMFMLKSRDPAKYNDKWQGNAAKTLSIEVTHRYASPEQPSIEVQYRNVSTENRAESPDSQEAIDVPADVIGLTPRKD